MAEILSILEKDKRPKALNTSALGSRGENLECEFLINDGYQIVMRNFKVPVGRNSKGVQVTGEIDIVAIDQDTLCFVEVKTRRSDAFTSLTTNVDRRKQRQITRTARIYRQIFGLWEMPHRFDVVTVLMPKHADRKIELLRGFWDEAKFSKRRWEAGERRYFV